MLYGCALKSILAFLVNEPLERLTLGCAPRVDCHLCCCVRHGTEFLVAGLLDLVACTRCWRRHCDARLEAPAGPSEVANRGVNILEAESMKTAQLKMGI